MVEATGSMALRGIAHPMRVRLLGLLRVYGPSTATRLAQQTGESSAATSYHLRQLAAYGFIVEDPTLGRGRERWWRPVHRETVVGPLPDVAAHAEVAGYLRAVAASYAERMVTWVDGLTRLPTEWANAGNMSDWFLRLDPEAARRLADELRAVVERARAETGDEPGSPGEVVSVQIQVLPFPVGGVAEGDGK